MRSKFKWIFTLLLAFTMQFSFAQEKTVTGVVSDKSGPAFGANVVVEGTKRGTQTDMDGKYTIKVNQGETLVFSFIGMESQSIKVGATNKINVKLVAGGAIKLDELLIGGAVGIKKKKDAITSAQQQISGKDIGLAQNPNAIQALAGKISGLQINTVSSGVNATTRIVLRGSRSLTGNSQALVVIDNAISNADLLAQIPSEMIESINVIKGAQGAALYGDQGSNGVILVNTKKGSSSDKPQVNITSAVDFSSVLFVPRTQMKYGQGWTPSAGEAFGDANGVQPSHTPLENTSWGPAFNDPAYAGTLQATGLPQADGTFKMLPWSPIKDNVKKFFNTGLMLQNGVTVNLGNEDGYAMVAYNRLSNQFVVDGDKATKNTLMFKAGKKMGRFSIDGAATYVAQSSTETSADLYYDLLQTPVNVPVEQFSEGNNYHHWTIWARSPYWSKNNVRYNDALNNFNGNIVLGYKINKNISVRNTSNVKYYTSSHEYHNNGQVFDYTYNLASPYTIEGSNTFTYQGMQTFPDVLSSYYIQNYKSVNYYNDLIFNFDYKLSEKMGLKFNIGNNIQDNSNSTITSGGLDLLKPGIYNVNNLGSQNGVSTTGNDGDTPGEFYYSASNAKLINEWGRSRKVAGFFNADLNYEDYLFLNATARVEKSSVIKSSQFYPSVGMSWVPTKQFESLKDSKKISYLKLYGSYVITGNSTAVGTYKTFGATGVLGTGYPFGNNSSYVYPYIGQTDPNITPEYVYTKEIGFNTLFFNNRVGLDGSFYVNDTKKLINNSSVSTPSGISTWQSNVGALRNKGFEIDLTVIPVKTASFKWEMKGSYTTYNTKVLSLADGANEIAMQTLSSRGLGIYAVVGEDFPMIKGTTFVRDNQGRVVVDATGTPTNTSSLSNLGKATPDYILGYTNTLEYKGIRLSAVLDFRTGNKFYSDTKRLMTFTGNDESTADVDRAAGWVWPNSAYANGNPNTTPMMYPEMVTYFSNGNLQKVAEQYIVDGTALRVRELSLGYSLPSSVNKSLGIKSLSFSINARNPFILLAKDNRMYTDPEASNTIGNAQGYSPVGQYPTVKTYGFSMNLNF